MEKTYTRRLEMPKTAQEGLINFVQQIVNSLEADSPRAALLTAVDLIEDLNSGIYQVTIDRPSEDNFVDASGVNKR